MGVVFFKKRTSNAEYDKWAGLFPTTDDCTQVQSVLAAAQNRYAKESLEFTQTPKIKIKQKAQQKMERDTLGQYIADLKAYIKDLQCGVATVPQASASIANAAAPSLSGLQLTNNGMQQISNNLGDSPPVTNQSTNTAPDVQKKSNTMLFIGIGAAVLITTVIIILKKKD